MKIENLFSKLTKREHNKFINEKGSIKKNITKFKKS